MANKADECSMDVLTRYTFYHNQYFSSNAYRCLKVTMYIRVYANHLTGEAPGLQLMQVS